MGAFLNYTERISLDAEERGGNRSRVGRDGKWRGGDTTTMIDHRKNAGKGPLGWGPRRKINPLFFHLIISWVYLLGISITCFLVAPTAGIKKKQLGGSHPKGTPKKMLIDWDDGCWISTAFTSPIRGDWDSVDFYGIHGTAAWFPEFLGCIILEGGDPSKNGMLGGKNFTQQKPWKNAPPKTNGWEQKKCCFPISESPSPNIIFQLPAVSFRGFNRYVFTEGMIWCTQVMLLSSFLAQWKLGFLLLRLGPKVKGETFVLKVGGFRWKKPSLNPKRPVYIFWGRRFANKGKESPSSHHVTIF